MVKIAVLGYGTVGSGVVEVIERNRMLIEKRVGKRLEVKYVLDIRDFPGDPYEDRIVHDAERILKDPEVKIICETMGGIEPAYTYSKRALEAGKKERSGGFIEEDCYGYLPSIGLCMCHDRLGNHRKAFYYNEKAATYKPKDRYVALNRKYFREKWGM